MARLILPSPGEFVVVGMVYCWLWCSVWRFYVNRVHTAIAIKASLPPMANEVTENQSWQTTVIESIHHVWTFTKTVIKISDMKKISKDCHWKMHQSANVNQGSSSVSFSSTKLYFLFFYFFFIYLDCQSLDSLFWLQTVFCELKEL